MDLQLAHFHCLKKNMFRRMCFNVFAHNRDDHSKNFTYLYNEKNDSWHLSLHMILLIVILIMGSTRQLLMETGVIREKRNFWQ